MSDDPSTSESLDLRRDLHRHPELSGSESQTADRIIRFFEPLRPDLLIRGLGGHGAAFVFAGAEPGPTVLVRSELDAVPIRELSAAPHRSTVDGRSHACGHDGHMAILASVGEALSEVRPRRGRAVLLYQPSEEDGSGAAAVISDHRFEEIMPDLAFALHNLPGFPLGEVIVRSGPFCCASRGMIVSLTGTTAHAAQPETGTSPAQAVCRIIELFDDLSMRTNIVGEVAFATVVGARLGEDDAFGTAPGNASVMATLRCESDETLDRMAAQAVSSVRGIAAKHGLSVEIDWRDEFMATISSPEAVEVVKLAAGDQRVRVMEGPFRWSEDFGRFTSLCKGAFFGIGAGEQAPDLHNPDYDFSDELIPMGASLLERIIRGCLG